MANKTLTVRETAAALNCTIGHVYNLLWTQRLTAERDLKGWKISAASVQLYINNKKK